MNDQENGRGMERLSIYKLFAGQGKRRFERFRPDPREPVLIRTVKERDGRVLKARAYDISLGGVGVILNYFEKGRVETGDSLFISLHLPGKRPLDLKGVVRHVTTLRRGIIGRWLAGIMFTEDEKLDEAVFHIYAYFVRLTKRGKVTP